MRKLKVVDKNTGVKGQGGTIEIHWEPKFGEAKVDVYPGDSVLATDETGLTKITYISAQGGTEQREKITVTYGYGEAKKIVEKEHLS